MIDCRRLSSPPRIRDEASTDQPTSARRRPSAVSMSGTLKQYWVCVSRESDTWTGIVALLRKLHNGRSHDCDFLETFSSVIGILSQIKKIGICPHVTYTNAYSADPGGGLGGGCVWMIFLKASKLVKIYLFFKSWIGSFNQKK